MVVRRAYIETYIHCAQRMNRAHLLNFPIVPSSGQNVTLTSLGFLTKYKTAKTNNIPISLICASCYLYAADIHMLALR